jgi:site-specific recombinase XerD
VKHSGKRGIYAVHVFSVTGRALTQKVIQVTMRRTAQRANVKPGVHILRHTFCSDLAMRGAPARAIQELAGHQDLATTQRYMHLSPAVLDAAIRLLDAPSPLGQNATTPFGSVEK